MTNLPEIDDLPCRRWFTLAALLTIEIAVLSVRFDTGVLGESSGRVALILGSMPQLTRLFSIIVVAVLLVGGPSLTATLWNAWPRYSAPPSQWRDKLLNIHFAGLLVFVWLTWKLLEKRCAVGEGAVLWFLLWVSAGVISGAALALIAMPARIWRDVAVERWRLLALGVIIGSAVWTFGVFSTRVWTSLATCTLNNVYRVLGVFYNDVVLCADDFTVGTQSFQVTIAPQCSGYEGIGLIVAFLTAYLSYYRHHFRFPHCLLLLPAGAVAIWYANSLRIAALIAIGTSWSRAIALGGFHSQAGWLAFIIVALCTVIVARRIAWIAADRTRPAVKTATLAAVYLVPFLALLSAGMITAAFSNGFDSLYPARIVAASIVLWCFRRHYYSSRWLFCPQAIVAGATVFALWLPLGAMFGHWSSAAVAAPDPTNLTGSWWLSRLFGFLLIAPVAEELAFRGFLMRRLSSPAFDSVSPDQVTWPAVFGSSVAFGALHGGLWLAGSIAGVVYAMAWRWRGRLCDCIAAHATTNCLLAIYVLRTGQWSLWP